MIVAESVSFRYPGAEHNALEGQSFQLAPGSLSCLLGVNGSGKSTLLGLLAGLYHPDQGSLRVAGVALPDKNRRLQGKVALVPQDPDLYILGSLVEEDLCLGLDPRSGAQRRKALALAEKFGLTPYLGAPVQTLSHGQKRKLCLASALAAGAELLLLDEPFAGLDLPGALAMRETLLQNRAAGLTQLLSGHDLDLTADLADSFLLLAGGRLLSQGRAEEVFPLLAAQGVRPPCWWFTGGKRPLWLEDAPLPPLSALPEGILPEPAS